MKRNLLLSLVASLALATTAPATEPVATCPETCTAISGEQAKDLLALHYSLYVSMMQMGDDDTATREFFVYLLLPEGSDTANLDWNTLQEAYNAKVPAPCPFMTRFFQYKKGELADFNLMTELPAFGRAIMAQREKLESGEIMQSGSEVRIDYLPDDMKVYRVPLKELP